MCIPNKFEDGADQGPHFENHWPRLKLKLFDVRCKSFTTYLPSFWPLLTMFHKFFGVFFLAAQHAGS